MFEYLGSVGSALHLEMVKIYWVLLIPFVVLLFTLEVLKDGNPDVRGILRRILISVLMLLTFDWCLNSIASIGDAVTDQINGLEQLSEVLKKLGPNYSGHDDWFNLRETAIYVFSLGAYIVAYVGFFAATALTHFVWTILYVCSPLMILMYVGRSTGHITVSLYRGMIQVVIWKILWSILGVLLLRLAEQPEVSGMEDYLMAIVMNLCIGVSMLFIPLATKSLISDGMSSAASAVAMAPAFAAAGAIKLTAGKVAAKAAGSLRNQAASTMRNRVLPRVERFRLNRANNRSQNQYSNQKQNEAGKHE